jgi:hypothetical protein
VYELNGLYHKALTTDHPGPLRTSGGVRRLLMWFVAGNSTTRDRV